MFAGLLKIFTCVFTLILTFKCMVTMTIVIMMINNLLNLSLCIKYDNDTASQQVGINDIAPLHFTMNDLQNLIKEKSLLNEGLVPPNEEITKLQEILSRTVVLDM